MWKNDPLERPDPMPERGDDTREQVFMHVGAALNQWENTEEAFAMLFGAFVLPERPIFPAYRAYGAIASASVRGEILKAAASAFFHDRATESNPLQEAFEALMKRYKKAAARRNEIAHAIVVGSYVGHEPPHEPTFLGHFLYPPMYSERKRNLYLDAAYRYSSKELIHYELQFDELLKEANRANAGLQAFYKSLPAEHRPR